MVGAVYVGLATIAGYVWWFLYSDNGPKLPYTELVSFRKHTVLRALVVLTSFSLIEFSMLLVFLNFHYINILPIQN